MTPHGKNISHEHRSCIVIDVEDSSSRLNPELMVLRAALYDIVDDALTRSLIKPSRWIREDRGDGIMLLIDSFVQKIEIVDPLLDHLVAALLRHNEEKALHNWMRLRVALHAGEVQHDIHGWGGEDLTLAFRLADAPAVKTALAAAPRAQCVIVASDWFYGSVIRHGHRSIDPSNYRPVKVSPGNGSVRAWVRIPGYAVPPGVPDPSESSAVALAAALLVSRPNKEKISGEAVRAFRAQHTSFLALVRDRFRNDREAQDSLAAAQQNPDDPEAVAALGAALQRYVLLDDPFAAELEQMADRAHQSEAMVGGVAIQAETIKSIFNEKVTIRRDFNIS